MVNVGTRINAYNSHTGKLAVAIVTHVSGYMITARFAEGNEETFHISNVSIYG